MYCVTCGGFLHSTNQAGLVCLACKQARMCKRWGEKQPLSIHYCFRCGNPYQPQDTSIHHRSCTNREEKPLIISLEARKDTDVLVVSAQKTSSAR